MKTPKAKPGRLPSSSAPPNGVPRWQITGICLALVFITLVVFFQTLGFNFINSDDGTYVFNNPMVNSGLTIRGILWAFTHLHSSNWHPLTWISHMVDCEIFGAHPGGQHLTNVLLHVGVTVALFLVLRQMTGFLWRSAFVAAVFAVHPLRVESVAWISERKDVLSGFFFVLTLGAYTRYVRQNRPKRLYAACLILFAFGLMSKPMLVTLPLVLLLLDYWPLRRKEPIRLLVIEKIPMLALSALSCVATIIAQQDAIQSVQAFPLAMRFGNALISCETYLVQTFYPVRLAACYPWHVSLIQIAFAAVVVAIISAIAWRGRKAAPWLLTGWLWYLVMLAPVIGIIQAGDQPHADRYTYLPQIGIDIAVVWLAAEWAAKIRAHRPAVATVMAGTVIILMARAHEQAGYWKYSEALWNHALACTTNNFQAHFNLGDALVQQGKYADAAAEFETALALAPKYLHCQGALAWLLATCPDASVRNGPKALELARQANEESRGNNPAALRTLAAAYAETGNFPEATQAANNALRLVEASGDPDAMLSQMRAELALYQSGKPYHVAR